MSQNNDKETDIDRGVNPKPVDNYYRKIEQDLMAASKMMKEGIDRAKSKEPKDV